MHLKKQKKKTSRDDNAERGVQGYSNLSIALKHILQKVQSMHANPFMCTSVSEMVFVPVKKTKYISNVIYAFKHDVAIPA